MSRILAIDFGLKRTGLAVTDPEQLIASGLATVETHSLLAFLSTYLQDHEVEKIVVGEPKRMNNTASGPVNEIAAMIKKLRAAFGLEIVRMDERFTSKIAARSLIESGVKKSERRNKGLLDTVSAILILQSYLEQEDRKRKNERNNI